MKRLAILFVLIISLTSISPSAYAGSDIPVLMYHNVTTDSSLVQKDDSVHITSDRIEEHFIALKNAGYNTISLDEYYSYRMNNTSLPANPIIITFDDGYTSNYEYAYPLLKKHNMKACIFVIASRMDADNVAFPHFSWDEAREMEKSGLVQIESHSFTHPDFSTISYPRTVMELRISKAAIETNLNKECKFLGYPYGKMNITSTAVANAAGYKMAFVSKAVNAKLSDENMYEMPRYTVKGTWTSEQLLNEIKD